MNKTDREQNIIKSAFPDLALKPFHIFILPLVFFLLSDALMAYTFPVVVEESVHSNILMGLIMSASSVVGMLCDLTFPVIFRGKSWKAYLVIGVLLSILFPITAGLGVVFSLGLMFLFGSAVWGMYFEMSSFAQANFIVEEERNENHVNSWGAMLTVTQAAYILGPIVGSLLLDLPVVQTFGVIIAIQLIALFFSFTAVKSIPDRKVVHMKSSIAHAFGVLKELKSWGVISTRIAPFLILNFLLIFIDAAFWTVGAFLGMGLVKGDGFDWLPITLYQVPMVMGSIVLSRLPFHEHKKRYSQLATLAGGIILAMLFLVTDGSYLILALIFLASLFFAVARPFHFAVMSDLLERVGKGKDDLVGIQNASSSLAYIIGPIFAGFVAEISSYQFAFASFGALIAVVAVFLLIFTPRKLRLPEKELGEIYKG